MILLSFFKPKYSIGLSFDKNEVQLLQLKWVKREASIEQLAVLDLPEGSIRDGEIVNKATVLATIEQIVTMTKTQGKRVAIALPSHCVMIHRVPVLKDFSDDACQARIVEHIGQRQCSKDDFCFDFVKQDTLSRQSSLLYVAVRQQQLSRYVNLVREGGLEVGIVDIDSFALERAMALFFDGNNPLLSMARSSFVDKNSLFDFAPRLLVCYGLALRGA